ncbi:MAG: histidine phosphatase family protein [Acidobacteria bacterium]|nr:histidine phosphatase family protein [Acidobacteriota bacterium]
MPTTKLFLVRHGQSAGNAEGRFGGHSPTPLSELGFKQAAAAAQALQKEGVTAIYSSDLLRAMQTAELLSKLIDIPVEASSAFRERNVGVLEGLTFDESKAAHPEDFYALVNRNLNHVITKGESYRQLLDRSTKELWQILNSHIGGRVAIFSHTGVICYLTLHLMGAIHRGTRTTPWLITSNCGINRFEVRNRRNIRIVALNDTRHLMQTTGEDAFAAR